MLCKLLYYWKYVSSRCEFLRFYCYLCPSVKDLFDFNCNTKIGESFDMAEFRAIHHRLGTFKY